MGPGDVESHQEEEVQEDEDEAGWVSFPREDLGFSVWSVGVGCVGPSWGCPVPSLVSVSPGDSGRGGLSGMGQGMEEIDVGLWDLTLHPIPVP